MWQHFDLLGAGTVLAGSSITAVARAPSTMETWSVGRDGSVRGAFWYEGQNGWTSYELSPPGSAASTAGIASLARVPNSMEVWFAGSDGSLQGRYWYEGDQWKPYQLAAPGSVMAGNGIAALSRIPNSMEVFYVGPDASIRDANWYEGGQWNHFILAGPGSVDPGTQIAALSRQPNTLEIWWVGADGSVRGAFWYEGQSGWTQYELAPAGSASGAITALSRLPGAMEVWWTAPNGSVQGAFWYEGQEGGWRRYELAGPGSAALGGGLAASSRMPNTMEIWWIGPGGSVEDAFWYEGGQWQRFQLMPAGSAAANGSISAVSRRADTMEVFWQKKDGAVADSFVYVPMAKRDRFADKIVGSPRDVLAVSAVSRHPDSIDVVAVGRNGAHAAVWGEGEGWWHDIDPASLGARADNVWQPIGDATRSAPVALVSRRPQLVDAFCKQMLSQVATNWKFDGRWAANELAEWHALGSAGGSGFTLPSTDIGVVTAVARTPDNLDLFTVGKDGTVQTCWWSAGADWSGRNGWMSLGGSFPDENATVACVSRQPGILDLFCVGKDGKAYTAWWTAGDGWSCLGRGRGWMPLGGKFAAGTAIAAVARTPNNLDLFAIAEDGQAYTAWWNPADGWSSKGRDWHPIGGNFARRLPIMPFRPTPVTALARTPNNLDLFAIDEDGIVQTSWWHAGGDWSGRSGWHGLGGTFPKAAKVAAVARTPNNIDLFVPGLDGKVWTSWWSAGQDWSGRNGWMHLGSDEVYWSKPIETGNLNPIGGRVEVWVRANGTYTVKFHVHNSGAVGVSFMVRATVVLPCGIAITEAFSGRVDADPRNADLTVDRREDLIRYTWSTNNFGGWPSREHGWVDVDTEFTGVFGVVTDVLAAIGAVFTKVVGTAVGVVLGLSHALGNLVGALGMSGVFGVVAGAIVMVLPGGSLLMATVAGIGVAVTSEIIRALVKDRAVTAAEKARLKDVFHDSVDFDDVRVTNFAGIGGRPFTNPGVDGRTYLNMGDIYQEDYTVNSDRLYTFVHEMTHAWQIQHAAFLPGAICSGIYNQANHSLASDHVYVVGPPSTPWRDFNLEQQASVVEEWFRGEETLEWRNAMLGQQVVDRPAMSDTDPYFHYIRDHVRPGVN